MSRSRSASLAARLASALLLALPAAASDGVDAVVECVKANFPARTSVQRVEFRSRDRIGAEREILGRVSWKRFDDGTSRILVRIHEPPDLQGAGLLFIEKRPVNDIFLYLPDLRKVRRVTSHMLSGSLFGSDFTYEDFMHLQNMARDGRTERHEDASLDGIPVYVIAHFPADPGSAYERVVTYVDRTTCVPLRSEMWERGNRLRKVLTTDPSSLFERNGVRMPRRLQIEDLRDQTSTRLLIDEIEVGAEIPRKVFTLTHLERP
jgi:hypothetical protein